MHEYPVTVNIIETAQRRASECGASAVLAINLVVGDYSGYLADSIALYFDLLAEETICSGAALNIERIAPKLRCVKCESLFPRSPFSFECPDCGGEGEPTSVGREFYIKSIIVSGDECDRTIDNGIDL